MECQPKIYPEIRYEVNHKITYEDLCKAKKNGEFVVGRVLNWNSAQNSLYVDLGNNFTGIVPLEEISIYSVQKLPNGSLSPEGYKLIGRNICACVTQIQGNIIYLSRKINMQKSFKILSAQEDKIVESHICSILPTHMYLDVGHGLSGMLHICESSVSRLNHISEIGFEKGDIITTKMTSFDSSTHFISLNFKDLFTDSIYNIGDLIEVVILCPINDRGDGYFAYVNPAVSGIINPPNWNPSLKLTYGTHVIASVRRSKEPGKLRLKFVSWC